MGLLETISERLNITLVRREEWVNVQQKASVFDNIKLVRKKSGESDITSGNPRPKVMEKAGVRGYEPLPGLQLSLVRLAYASDILRNIVDKITWKIFRNDLDWEPKFTRKCLNCGTEYQYEIKVCDAFVQKQGFSGNVKCGGLTVQPDEGQKKQFEPFLLTANENSQTLLEVLEEINEDVEILDDGYLIINMDHTISTNGVLLESKPHEFLRGDPIYMRFIADEQSRLGRDKKGNPVRICPFHRDKPILGELTRKYCSDCLSKGNKTFLQPAHFKDTSSNRYYIKNEVIHISKYSPSLTYGFPPVFSLRNKAELLAALDIFNRDAYIGKKSPKTMLIVRTMNRDSFIKGYEYILDKAQQDPHNAYPLIIQEKPEGQGNPVQVLDLAKTHQEMQAIEFMRDNRAEIASFYGVSNIFINNTQASGGLNNEGLQFGVTNESAERGQHPYNGKMFPNIMKICGITDWVLKINPPEEQDEVSDLQREGQKMDNMLKMRQAGFTIRRLPDGDFEYSELPETIPASSGNNLGETNMGATQRHSGEPGMVMRGDLRSKANVSRKGIEEKAYKLELLLDESLDELIGRIDFKKRPSEQQFREIIQRVTGKMERDLREKSGEQLKAIYRKAQEEVEKELNMNILFDKADENALQVMQTHPVFTSAYSEMSASVSQQLNNVMAKAFENPQNFTLDKIVENMKAVANDEEYRLERIARTETQHVTAKARINSYSQMDDGTGQYVWFGPEDVRTSHVCKAIKRRSGVGVSLERLKAIVEEESMRHNSMGWQYREFTPHVGCRHTLLRAR